MRASAATDNSYLYVFLDEGGNFDFSAEGTHYFTLTGVTAQRPFAIDTALSKPKYELIEGGMNLQSFHAAEDKQRVREEVFGIIEKHLAKLGIDSISVESGCEELPEDQRGCCERVRDLPRWDNLPWISQIFTVTGDAIWYYSLVGEGVKAKFGQRMGETHWVKARSSR
jgi:hypothetical protein